MKIYKTFKRPFLLISLILLNNLIAPLAAIAEESIPIPPKRPDVLSVSPAYIEELRNRGKSHIEINAEKAPPPPISKDKLPSKDIESKITKINSAELINILEPHTQSTSFIPKPAYKPSFNARIEPAAQKGEPETTLVSFALQPEQISLDENLRYFLEKHAVRILREDKSLEIQIHAYATPIEGEVYSDIRISLARALEIRSFLIDKNIEASRLKLTPVGRDSKNNNNNRIDLIFITKE